MGQEGQYVLIIRHMEDKRTRYITAKKLMQLFRQKNFASWKEQLDSGGVTVLTRSDNMAELHAYKESLELIGAAVEVVDQRTQGGLRVY